MAAKNFNYFWFELVTPEGDKITSGAIARIRKSNADVTIYSDDGDTSTDAGTHQSQTFHLAFLLFRVDLSGPDGAPTP